MQLPKTKQQMAEEMNISLSTFQRRLKAINFVVPRGLIMPEVQREIYQRLGFRN